MKKKKVTPCYEEDFVLHCIRFIERHHKLVQVFCSQNNEKDFEIEYNAFYKDVGYYFFINKHTHEVNVMRYLLNSLFASGRWLSYRYTPQERKYYDFSDYYNHPHEPSQ